MQIVTFEVLYNNLNTIVKSPLFHILLIFIMFDVITGVIKAVKMKTLNSKISAVGMMKHFVVALMVMLVGIYSIAFNVRIVSYLFCSYYIASYGLSLIENYEAIGMPFPDSLRPFFKYMRDKSNQEIKDSLPK